MNIIPLKDGRHALVATGGSNAHELSLIDLDQARVVDRRVLACRPGGPAKATRR